MLMTTSTALDSEYPNIAAARQRTREVFEKLRVLKEFEAEDTSIVVHGSIARGEVTEGSDADWTLLIDGPSDPEHFRLARHIDEVFVGLGLKKPGREGAFGELVSSHELIHHIAGVGDTNRNLTRRILLIVESHAITQPLLRDRVLRKLLERYITHDTTVPRKTRPPEIIPHFLLNDVVRYWRTMASDYAAKMWERGGEGWAIRNVKLRFSRKLIFAAGLLICFAFELNPPVDRAEILDDINSLPERLANHTMTYLGRTPLDVVESEIRKHGSAETAQRLLSAYDGFIGVLADADKRVTLETLKLEDAISSDVWQECRSRSQDFRESVSRFFLKDDEKLQQLMLRYAIF